MSNENTFRATRYLPQALVATALVVVLPVLIVWIMVADGVVSSPWVGAGLALALSFAASILGSAYWKRRGGPGDLLFSELLLWGWLRRFRSERRLASAVGLLARRPGEDGLPETDESIEHKSRILTQLAAALDALDSYTDGHSRRVALHAAMIARKMGLSREHVAKISMAAAVHDVGKLKIPSEVLSKPGRLTVEEFELVKRHADEGAQIVSCMEDPAITAMVRHHHERFDGSGYPAGLTGEQIPTGARIIAVADTFDALTSERAYRGAVRHKTALGIIRVVSRTQLDPVAVRAFLKCYSGKRAVFFWTLLAVSPQRALASVGGRNGVRAGLGSATTVAMPAALAALVAASIGTAARPPLPLRFAQSQPIQLGVVLPILPTDKHATAAHARRARSGRPVRARQAVLGAAATHTPTPGSLIGHAHGGTGPGNGASGGTVGGGTVGGGTVGGGSPPPIRHGGGAVRSTPNRGGGKKKPPSSGRRSHPPTHAAPKPSAPPPPSSTPGDGTPAGGEPGNGGGSGGNQGGNQGGGSGGKQGGGSGGGGSGGGGPGSGPPSKQACFDGGWASFGFPNQGQCVAFVEHSLHG